MVKNKYFLFSIFLIIFLFFSANFVSAMEVDLGLGDNPTLPQYVVFLFSWGISIAGALAVISFVIGAVGLIMSGDNPELASSSRGRMKGAILGLVLTFASWLIINTINPVLLTPTLTPLPPVTIPTPPPQPGVYFFAELSCSGDSSGVYTTSGDVGYKLGGEIKSFEIINDPASDIYYGIILHKDRWFLKGGTCSPPITDAGCHVAAMSARAADIFRLNMYPGASGDGVTFYSEPFGLPGARASSLNIPDNQISSPFSCFNLRADTSGQCIQNKMCFDFHFFTQPDTYKYKCYDSNCGASPRIVNCSQGACETFRDCPGSILIKGSYLVGLYSSGSYCQTFTQNVTNLDAEPFLPDLGGIGGVDSVYIIPTQ